MKFKVSKASDPNFYTEIELNSLEELETFIEYNGTVIIRDVDVDENNNVYHPLKIYDWFVERR